MWEKHNGRVNVICTRCRTLTIPTTDEETLQESDRNDRGAIGSDDEDCSTPPEFETNTNHGLDNLDKQYPFTEDETFVDFIVEEDNREGVDCGSSNFKGDSCGESDASDHSHCSGHHDVDLVDNTIIQRGSSSVSRPWTILGSEQYSFQTINHESSTSNGRFYKGRIFSSKKDLKRELSLLALKQHFEFRIKRSSKARFQATCKDENCSFIVHVRKIHEHKGIKKVMRIVYPDAPHGLCVFHMTMNLKNTFKREDATCIFKRAYQIYRESEFNEEMSELMQVHQKAYDDLMTIGPSRWSHAYSHVRRYFMITSNIAECINSCLQHARQFPITVLIEYIRDMMQKWFHDQRTFADSLRT
ncbi:hypothetical protein Dsin_005112 [Dipteronia sinensis]|uniref:Transposase MuDR plant domain-containing protein n=1 Tax=Dipteronia sinensis TaxID=43782 RepID=A0AAE0EG70_9ROSI|nr:hypothetical protein Dsin_005112 [Dipteronia sinensis]